MTKQEVILDFIDQFRRFGPEVGTCFRAGMCWHFTLILRGRFGMHNRIVYDPIANHFAVEIDGRIYDIDGDITDEGYKWEYWDTYWLQDLKHTERIRRDCIYKMPENAVLCDFCAHSWQDDWHTLICGLDNKPVDPEHNCERGVLNSG